MHLQQKAAGRSSRQATIISIELSVPVRKRRLPALRTNSEETENRRTRPTTNVTTLCSSYFLLLELIYDRIELAALYIIERHISRPVTLSHQADCFRVVSCHITAFYLK